MSGPGQDGARPDEYFRGLNLLLAGAVPQAVRRILEVGCAEGRLGAHLKSLDPSRTVIGLELEPGPAAEAAKRLDQVLVQDAEASLADLEPGSLDCILYGDVLEHFRDPLNVLLRTAPYSRPGERFCAACPTCSTTPWPLPCSEAIGSPRPPGSWIADICVSSPI